MSGPVFDEYNMIDMSAFTATDPDDAISPSELDAVRHVLVTAPVPELPGQTWQAYLERSSAWHKPGGAGTAAIESAHPSGVNIDDLIPASQEPATSEAPGWHDHEPGPSSAMHEPGWLHDQPPSDTPHPEAGNHDPGFEHGH
jgi:hypothetical protein